MLTEPYSSKDPYSSKSIDAKKAFLEGKYRELERNTGHLPQSAPGDDVQFGLSIDGHLRQIALIEAKLAADSALYAATCNDDEPPPKCPNRFMEKMPQITGLTGGALLFYVIISEGTRLFPPRNLIPCP
jgi:hypothetical protein